MALWRCNSLKCEGKTFLSERPKCPVCGLDAEADARFADVIIKLTIIHFDPPSGVVRGRGKNVTLCDGTPVRSLGKKHEQASGDPEAVNCQACRAHKDFSTDLDLQESVPEWSVGKEIKELT